MHKLFVVLGPTGVGKTEVSLRIARHLGVPVINADSRQIYQELPIGTAAPTKEQQSIRHYFVGSRHIEDYYNASMYEQDVLQLLPQLFGKHDGTALLSGGSMMYIDAVCDGIDDIPTIDTKIREKVDNLLKDKGLQYLVEELRKLDPEHYMRVDKNNPRRVAHAMEICLQTGKPYSSFRTHTKKQRPFEIIKIGLSRPREEMYSRINERVLKMMRQGLIQEAQTVYPFRHLNALHTVGYRELFDFFEGKCTQEEVVERIQSNTRKYMRKQLTWFKKDNSIQWFSPDNIESIFNYIDKNRLLTK